MIRVPLSRVELSSLYQECIYDECSFTYGGDYKPNQYLKQLTQFTQKSLKQPVHFCVMKLVYDHTNVHHSLQHQLNTITQNARAKQRQVKDTWMICIGASCVIKRRFADKLVFEMCPEGCLVPLSTQIQASTLPVASTDKYLRIVFGTYE
jgi:hypothetical protein